MRKTIMSLFTAATLLTVAATAVGAQSDSTTEAPAPVTIEVSDIDLVSPGVMVADKAGSTYQEHGGQMTMDWQASDPRLSGDVTCAATRLIQRDGSFVEAEAFAVENDGGRWVGEGISYSLQRPASDVVVGNGLLPEAARHDDLVLLQGEGGYEGSSALVDIDWSQDPPLITGTIFGGRLPSAPDLATR
jgi:hypothetical protein